MSTNLATRASNTIAVDEEAVLKHLGIDPRNPAAQALILTCERYGLDPILKHAVLIQGRLYVTRDGLLHVAHASGKLDGIEVLEQGGDNTHFVAKVAVYRKDMSKPFAYVGRYPKNGSNKNYGPEMAVKCAEVMALRRAFDVAIAAKEEMWEQDIETTATSSNEAKSEETRAEQAEVPQAEGASPASQQAPVASASPQPVEEGASTRKGEDQDAPGVDAGPAPEPSEDTTPSSLSPEEELNEKDRLVSLLQQAIELPSVKLSGVIRAATVICTQADITAKPPSKEADIKDLPLVALQRIVEKLDLENLMGATA